LGDFDKSLSDTEEFIRLNPNDPAGYFVRANIYKSLGNYERAVSDLRKARYLVPEDLQASNMQVLTIMGDEHGLIGGRVSSPSYITICNSLAWMLATCTEEKIRNGKESVTLATTVCATSTWKDASFIDTLAAGYAELGDFDNAIKYEKQALQLIKSPSKVSDRFQDRLSLYEKHQPYRQTVEPGKHPNPDPAKSP
jgi:tetratricopeptide (TPR) repeat protein